MTTRTTSLQSHAPSRLLHEYLELQAPLREQSISRWMVVVSICSAVICFALSSQIGPALSLLLIMLLSSVALYYVALLILLRWGYYHRVLVWFNAVIEVSIPAVIFFIDYKLQGAEFALTTPVLAIWGSLIALNGLRTNRVLSVAAGLLAALEYLALYWYVALPSLSYDTLETLQPAMILTRAFLLVCAGVVTAIFAGHLIRQAEDALGSVRERDWMGRYIIHERIGTGGMAEVFRATYCPEGGFEKRVALKRVLPKLSGDGEFVAMFRTEAELGSWLAHPNIVQVLDLGLHNDGLYLAMEYIDGVTLTRLLEVYPEGLPVPTVAWIALGLAKALDYTHCFRRHGNLLGLVHRDVNPPNVMISREAEVKLSDFGIVRAVEEVKDTDLLRTVSGKLTYLAPEQVTGAPVDGRTDLFSLGLTLHECLTGQPVFAADPVVALRMVVEERVRDPRHKRRDVPGSLAELVNKLTEPDPLKRYTSAKEVIAALQGLPHWVAPSPAGESQLAHCVRHAVELGARVSMGSLQQTVQIPLQRKQ